MSCDYSVWHTTSRLSDGEAGELHMRLCEGDTSGVSPHPGIAAFYEELTALHPALDSVPQEQLDDRDLCPWSAEFDRSDGHITLSCVWSKANDVGALVAGLARKHGLAFYDPQSERVVYPGDEPARKPWWKLRK